MSIDSGGPIDQDHQHLFALFNKIEHDFTKFNKQTMLKDLSNLDYYCVYHFAQEEGIMRQIGFPDIDKHIERHQKIRQTVLDIIQVFSKDINENKLEEVHGNMIMLMRSWIMGHNISLDMQLIPYIKEYKLKQ